MSKTFGQWLKRELEKNNKTQKELAAYADISTPYITKLIKHEMPSPALLRKICAFLKQPYEDVAAFIVDEMGFHYRRNLIKRYYEEK